MEHSRLDVNRNVVLLVLIPTFLLVTFAIFVWYFCKRHEPESEPHPVPLSLAGLHPQAIESLETYRFREERVPRECLICLAVFKNDEVVVQLPNCSHFFHTDYEKKLLKVEGKLPYMQK
jgi:hypothetical protein